MNDALLTISVKTDTLNGYVASAMQLQYSNSSKLFTWRPTEKRFGLRPALTPAQLSTLDLESIESGMAHADLTDVNYITQR